MTSRPCLSVLKEEMIRATRISVVETLQNLQINNNLGLRKKNKLLKISQELFLRKAK
jgi:hypothetical protein